MSSYTLFVHHVLPILHGYFSEQGLIAELTLGD
jgi:hypothetical protein